MVKTYDMHDRLAERRAALEAWGAFVERLVSGDNKVVLFAAARGLSAS
jgi:hypothetical protein